MDHIADISERLEALAKENEALKEWQAEASNLVQMLANKADENRKKISELKERSYINRLRAESVPYELRDTNHKSPVFTPNIMTDDETLEAAVSGMSLGSFNESEFEIITSQINTDTPSWLRPISEKLREALFCEDPNYLVGLNRYLYGNLEGLDSKEADRIREYMRPNIRKLHAGLFDKNRTYGSILIQEYTNDVAIARLKKLWNQKDCLLVAEEQSEIADRDLIFDNCKSLSKILCTSQEALESYEDVLAAILNEPIGSVVIISLSPIGPALSYDLFNRGYHAVDIGNIKFT